jgi:hypothetical protein
MFERKKIKRHTTAALVTDKVATKIVAVINHLQNGFASFMNKRTQHFTTKMWKVLIVVFTAGWGSLSFYFFWYAFINHQQTPLQQINKANNHVFILKQKHNDSLDLIEKVYEQRNGGQLQKEPVKNKQ